MAYKLHHPFNEITWTACKFTLSEFRGFNHQELANNFISDFSATVLPDSVDFDKFVENEYVLAYSSLREE